MLAAFRRIVSRVWFANRAGKTPQATSGLQPSAVLPQRQRSKNNMLEPQYQWLYNEHAPKILVAALAEYGTKEVPGAGDNPKILAWAQEVGSRVGIDYSADSIPWCGLFMGVVAKRAGYTPPTICVRASEWAKFGNPAQKAMLGDVCVLTRRGGGHVALYVGESEDGQYYYLLGGNQADAVNIKMFPVNRITHVRRCPWKVGQPMNVRPIILDAQGQISDNEA